MINNNNLYLVKWIDSYNSPSSWEYIDEMSEPDNMICVSVGWIEKETEENITIIPHLADIYNKESKGCGVGWMVIPKVAILERKKIKYKLNNSSYTRKQFKQNNINMSNRRY